MRNLHILNLGWQTIDHLLYTLTIGFAIVAGTGAGIMTLLTWTIFKETTFGRALFSLCLLLSVFTVYHVGLLVFTLRSTDADTLESGMYALLVVFVIFMVHHQRQIDSWRQWRRELWRH